MKTRYPKVYTFLSAIILLTFVALSFFDVSYFKPIDTVAYDIECLFSPSALPGHPTEFALLLAEPDTPGPDGQPPLSNRSLAELLSILEQRRPKKIIIAFPLMKNSPHVERLVAEIKKQILADPRIANGSAGKETIGDYLKSLRDELDADLILFNRVKRSQDVILSVPVTSRGCVAESSWSPKDLMVAKEDVIRYFRSLGLRALSPTFRKLYNACSGVGHAMVLAQDGLLGRMHVPFVAQGSGLLPSVPVLLAMQYFDATKSQVEVSTKEVKIGNRVIPLFNGMIILSPSQLNRPLPEYSISEILRKKRAPLELDNKIIIVGARGPLVESGRLFSGPFGKRISRPKAIAAVTENIIYGPYLKRTGNAGAIEIALILLVGFLGIFLFPRGGFFLGILLLPLLALLSLFAGWAAIFSLGLWIRVSYPICAAIVTFLLYISMQVIRFAHISKEAIEANHLLGLNFQKQGVMDLAFERFKMCPLNNMTRDLIYELAQECEARGLNTLAWQAYDYILKKGDFRDAAQRLARLKSIEKFPGFDSQGARKREEPLSETFIRQKKTVGKYQILKRLGKGTMGYVYKALDTRINRPVALKIIRFSDEFDEELVSEIRDRFFREAEIAGGLSHPSIVTVYDVGEDRDLTFLAMEYLEGHNLERYCNPDNLLPLMKVLEIIHQIADALEYAHQNGVIHRDIKPANIMLLKNGAVKVMDFGIAKAVSSSRTKTGVILGTPNYMSPEQIMGHKMDARSDIFSLGVLFFQLLTGQLPFHGKNISSLLYQITQSKHPSVRGLRPRVPKACEQIIDKALAKSRDNRFKSAGDMKRYVHFLIMRLREINNQTNLN